MRREPVLRSAIVVASISLFACGSASSSASGPSSASGEGEHPLLNNPGPDFTQPAVANGKGDVSLHTLEGKVAIVDFWATWCGPCKESFPKLQALHAKYGADGLAIVGISEDDDKGGIAQFARELGAKFPIAWDQDKAIAGKWKPKSMPSTFVVDKKGVVRFVHFGYRDGEEADIEREVKSLL